MVKKCSITKKKPMSGNNVSHAVNKTKRRFYPNLHNISFFSEVLGKKIKLKVSSRGIKTVEKNGGIDNYIIKAKTSELTEETKKLRKLNKPHKDRMPPKEASRTSLAKGPSTNDVTPKGEGGGTPKG